MRSAALRKIDEADASRAQDFVRELATLSHKHGIGIAGGPVLFVLERDDGNLAYDINEESGLTIASR